MLTRRNFTLGTLAGLGVAGLFPGAKAQTPPSIEDVLFDPDQPVLGNPQGDLTIVEYFDYQCPFCKRNHPDLMRAVQQDGNIRLLMKDWPIFGAASVRASQLVLGAVADGRYAQAHAALMATPGRLGNRDIDAALQGAGLQPRTLQAGYRQDRSRLDGLIARNSRQAAGFGLSGTPAFIIGTVIYAGAMNAGDLANAIQDARG
ncbi:MAG: DsbA family protein [Rhodobacteraceae bacterium]|nr:DsbA family protein [Paracoccaceae bacterium]